VQGYRSGQVAGEGDWYGREGLVGNVSVMMILYSRLKKVVARGVNKGVGRERRGWYLNMIGRWFPTWC
jgi:hypothetical protein